MPCTLLLQSTVPMTQTVQRTVDQRKLLVRWTHSLRRVDQSAALYCAARLLIGGNYWYAGLSVQRRVVQPAALYHAVRLLIHGNYWYARLSVRGEY